jgi:hypothetical protein
MIKLYKDYFLKHDVILFKNNIDEKKHLMWKYGGVPCIDADLWDKNKGQIEDIVFHTTSGRTFKSSKDNFENKKKEQISSFGRQYYMLYEDWETNK